MKTGRMFPDFLIADPRIVKNPKSIETITYKELRELSYMGASVLHEDAIFPVRKAGIPINIRNTNAPQDKGTLIVEGTCRQPKYTITGIAGTDGFVAITVEKAMMNSEVGFCRKVLQVFEDNGVSIEHMPSGIDTMSIFVNKDVFEEKEQKILADIHKAVNPDHIELESNLALDCRSRTRYEINKRNCRPHFLRTCPRTYQCQNDRSGIK